jgi:hypothetical protein
MVVVNWITDWINHDWSFLKIRIEKHHRTGGIAYLLYKIYPITGTSSDEVGNYLDYCHDHNIVGRWVYIGYLGCWGKNIAGVLAILLTVE